MRRIFWNRTRGQRGRAERAPRKRGGKSAKRGLSDEQVPVLVARDRQGNVLDAVLPDRSAASALVAFGSTIGPDNVLCIDDGRTLRKAGVQLGVPLRVIPKGRHSVPGSPVFHIQGVNGYHSRLKDWMRKFNGVATKNLQNYLGWRRLYENKDVVATPSGWMMALAL